MKSKKIMVVEDEKLTMLFIVESLREEGYEEIYAYSSREEVMEGLHSGLIPDLILMDINIKGAYDGIQTAREILNVWDLPIIFMSAYNDKETIKEILSLSLYGFISKPFDERELSIACELAFENFKNNLEKKELQETNINKKSIKLCTNYYYDIDNKRVSKDNHFVKLGSNQQIVLDSLIRNINTTVSKEQLSFELWNKYEESDSALRTIIYLLRKKLVGINISSQSKRGYLLQVIN